jgi:YHS domain-containing protein
MLRWVLEFVLMLVIARSFWRLVGGVMDGLGGALRTHVSSPGAPDRGVPMVRDPVCGTFVLPERAVSLSDGRQHMYFCSTACRDKYRARTA